MSRKGETVLAGALILWTIVLILVAVVYWFCSLPGFHSTVRPSGTLENEVIVGPPPAGIQFRMQRAQEREKMEMGY